jgi:hypothetical protein
MRVGPGDWFWASLDCRGRDCRALCAFQSSLDVSVSFRGKGPPHVL